MPKVYSELKKDIKILVKRNVPMNYEDLQITNLELINEARIDKHLTSKVKGRLLLNCLNEEISNSKDTLIAEAKYLNIKMRK